MTAILLHIPVKRSASTFMANMSNSMSFVSEGLAPFDLVYQTPSRCWQDGMTISNGDLSAMAWEAEGFFPQWSVNQSQLWDERTPTYRRLSQEHLRRIASGELPHIAELSKEKVRNGEPDDQMMTPKYGGQLRLCFGAPPQHAPGHRITKRLHLQNATLETDMDKHLSHPRITSYVCATSNVLVVSLRQTSILTAFQNRIELFRTEETDTPNPIYHAQGDRLWFTEELATMSYAVAALVIPRGGGQYREQFERQTHPCYYDRATPTKNVQAQVEGDCAYADIRGDADILLTIQPHADQTDCLDQAWKRLTDARVNLDQLYQDHVNYWQDFWQKNQVSLGDGFLDQLWYLSTYYLRCGMGGALPYGLCGPWFERLQTRRQALPWKGYFTNDYNAQVAPQAAVRINHPELALSTFAMVKAQLPNARQNAAELYEMPGAYFPLSCGPNGREISSGPYRFCQGSGPYWSTILFQHYLYTHDEAFLRDTAYPIIREVAVFFASYLRFDQEEELYHLRMSQNPELMYLHLQDPIDTLCFLKTTLKAAVTIATRTGQDQDQVQKWNHILGHYPQYAHWEHGFIPLDGLRPDHINHSRTLATAFPTGEADPLGDNQELTELARRELYNPAWGFFMKSFACKAGSLEGWTGKVYHRALPACRMGDRKLAWKLLEDLIACGVKPNGLISHNPAVLADSAQTEANLKNIPNSFIHHDYGPEPMSLAEVSCGAVWQDCTEDLECKEKMIPVIEGSGVYLLLISEMLVQCYNGVLRLFPAWPAQRSASFRNLRTEGALLVSARKQGENLESLLIKAEAKVDLKLANPWPDKTEINTQERGTIHLEPIMSLQLKKGETLTFGQPLPPMEVPAPQDSRTIRFSNGTGAILGKPSYSQYYAFLEELRDKQVAPD